MINQREAYICMFSLIIAIANIFLIIFKANLMVITTFSFAMSIAVLYFSWRELEELDIIQKIKMIFLMGTIEKDIMKTWKDSLKEIKKADNEFGQESKDR
jgi:hypothetical protein